MWGTGDKMLALKQVKSWCGRAVAATPTALTSTPGVQLTRGRSPPAPTSLGDSALGVCWVGTAVGGSSHPEDEDTTPGREMRILMS